MDPDRMEDRGDMRSRSGEVLLLYPNPAGDELTIELELKTAGPVKLELLDKSGDVIRSVEISNYEAGWHRVPVDITDLKPGELYYIRWPLPGDPVVKKFIKM